MIIQLEREGIQIQRKPEQKKEINNTTNKSLTSTL